MFNNCIRIVSLIAVLACASCSGTKEICREGGAIVEVRIYALPIDAEAPTFMSTAQVKSQGKFRRTLRDVELIDRICLILPTLPVSQYQKSYLSYRVFCEIVYSDGQVDSFGIDDYGSVEYEGVQYEGTYRLMSLLGVLCIDIEAIEQ